MPTTYISHTLQDTTHYVPVMRQGSGDEETKKNPTWKTFRKRTLQ
jgi:hypothetical protein